MICTFDLKKLRKESKRFLLLISFGNYISLNETEFNRRAIFHLLIMFLLLLLKKFNPDVIQRDGRPSSLKCVVHPEYACVSHSDLKVVSLLKEISFCVLRAVFMVNITFPVEIEERYFLYMFLL